MTFRKFADNLDLQKYDDEWRQGKPLSAILAEVEKAYELRGSSDLLPIIRALKAKLVPKTRPDRTTAFSRAAHAIWELRPAEDDSGYVLVRKKEERAVDLRKLASKAVTRCCHSNLPQIGQRFACVRLGQAVPVIVLDLSQDDDGAISSLLKNLISGESFDAPVDDLMPLSTDVPEADELDNLEAAHDCNDMDCPCECHLSETDNGDVIDVSDLFLPEAVKVRHEACARVAFSMRARTKDGFDWVDSWVHPTSKFSPAYMGDKHTFDPESTQKYYVEGTHVPGQEADMMYGVPNPHLPHPAVPGLNDRVRLIPHNEHGVATSTDPIFVSPVELASHFSEATRPSMQQKMQQPVPKAIPLSRGDSWMSAEDMRNSPDATAIINKVDPARGQTRLQPGVTKVIKPTFHMPPPEPTIAQKPKLRQPLPRHGTPWPSVTAVKIPKK